MLNEKYILEQAKRGDKNAFENIVREYERFVYIFAYRNCNNRQDAMDISQEVFIKFFKSLQNFNGKSSLSTWLFRITVNTCIDFFRKKKLHTVSFEDVREDINSDASQPEEAAEDNEISEQIQKALLLLSDEHRRIIVLRDVSGLDYTQISEILSVPQGTVKSRLFRARENLRKLLLSNGLFEQTPEILNNEGGVQHE